MEFASQVSMWRKELERQNAGMGTMTVFDSILVAFGEQQREIENLKLKNTALQPVYSRRQLEEQIQQAQQEIERLNWLNDKNSKNLSRLVREKERLKKVKEIEVYDNGVANIQYEDGESMLVNSVWYMDAVLTGWDEKDVGNKR